MKNSQEKAERIESVRDFLRLVDQMSKTSYFYLTEDQDNQEYVPDPTCPDFIKNMIGEFLSGSKIAEIPCESGIHYILKFGIHFMVYHLPGKEGYCIIGPLRYKRPARVEIASYVEKYHLEKNYHYILNSFLNSITQEHASAQPLAYILTHIYHMEIIGSENFQRVSLEDAPEEKINVAPPVVSDMRIIDKKYEKEQELQILVAQGKRIASGRLMELHDKTKYFRQSKLNVMYRMISLNHLCKQALVQAGIPPVYIEHIYSSYIREIAGNLDEIESREDQYSARMLDDYCKLARDNSTRNVSGPVRKIIHYVLLNDTRNISVTDIAAYLEMTPNYVSSIFKREMGRSLTNYINEVRIDSSMKLLTHTDLSIGEIAEKAGFDDYNYFSRIFKKMMNVSPTEYRKGCLKERGTSTELQKIIHFSVE